MPAQEVMERVFLEMFDSLKGQSSGDNRILGFISRTTGQLCAGTILPGHCDIRETLLMTMQMLNLKQQVDEADGGVFRFAESDPANPFSGAEVLSDNAEQDLQESEEPEEPAPFLNWPMLCRLVLRVALEGLLLFFLSIQPLFSAVVFVILVFGGLPTVLDLYDEFQSRRSDPRRDLHDVIRKHIPIGRNY